VNWRSRRSVLLLIAVVCSGLFAAGMAAAYLHRHDTVCSDKQAPVAQHGGLLGQVVVRCHNGEIVTLNN
jgi:hypothetical protein